MRLSRKQNVERNKEARGAYHSARFWENVSIDTAVPRKDSRAQMSHSFVSMQMLLKQLLGLLRINFRGLSLWWVVLHALFYLIGNGLHVD